MVDCQNFSLDIYNLIGNVIYTAKPHDSFEYLTAEKGIYLVYTKPISYKKYKVYVE